MAAIAATTTSDVGSDCGRSVPRISFDGIGRGTGSDGGANNGATSKMTDDEIERKMRGFGTKDGNKNIVKREQRFLMRSEKRVILRRRDLSSESVIA